MKRRSPPYPGIDLESAIEKCRLLEHTLGSNEGANREILAMSMGYTSVNGSAIVTISALFQYELLERHSLGMSSLSPLAMQIITAENEEEELKALKKAALNPTIFEEMYLVLPKFSELNIGTGLGEFLESKGYTESATSAVIQSFMKTIKYARLTSENVLDVFKRSYRSTMPTSFTPRDAIRRHHPSRSESIRRADEFSDWVRLVVRDGFTFRIMTKEARNPTKEQLIDLVELLNMVSKHTKSGNMNADVATA